MSIDIYTESLLALTQASRTLPTRPSVSTLWRWHARGVRGVRLETVVVGGVRYTSREALERFVERMTATSDGELVPARTTRQREAAIARAERELASEGI